MLKFENHWLEFIVKQNKPHSLFFLNDEWLIDLFILFYLLFLAVLGLRCCTRAFSSCGERGLLWVAVRGLLVAVASLVVEHRL